MISLKIKNYTIDEKETLLDLFDKTAEFLAEHYCTTSCSDCIHRKVCDDFNRARLFIIRDINNPDKKS